MWHWPTVSCPRASPHRPIRSPRACRAVDVLPLETTLANAQTAVCIVSSGIVQLVYYQSVVRMCLYMYARCRPVYMPYLIPPIARALVRRLHPCVLWSPSELPAASLLLARSVRDRRGAHLSCAWGVCPKPWACCVLRWCPTESSLPIKSRRAACVDEYTAVYTPSFLPSASSFWMSEYLPYACLRRTCANSPEKSRQVCWILLCTERVAVTATVTTAAILLCPRMPHH